jgi:hypothetical protein
MWHLSLTVGRTAERGGIVDTADLDRAIGRPVAPAGEP